MKLIHFYRKPISMFVMVAFSILLCFWANQAPAAPAAPAAKKNSAETMEQKGEGSPDFIEAESTNTTTVKKPHKFPWLLVGAVVVVGAAVLYFLVIKKSKYTLTVTLGAGSSGTPVTGKYKKSTVVPYSFSTQAGYINLKVMLDGAEVPSSGTVTMDKDHAITTSTTQVATIQINSSPAGAKIYLDQVDSGQVTPYTFSYSAATTKNVLLRLCGYQDYSETKSVALGQASSINATLQPGILDDFLVSSACWLPHTASEWTVSDGAYKFLSNKYYFNYNLYNYSFNQANWTAEVKMKRASGNTDDDNAIVLIEKMVGTKAYGYWFSYQANGKAWWIVRFNGYDIYNGGGGFTLLGSGSGSSIHNGLNQWNVLKIVRAGSQYAYYINNTKVRSFTDSTYNPHYLALGIMVNKQMCELQYDYVKLDFSGSFVDMSKESFINAIPEKNWQEQIK
jgi:hypothetical protein